MNKLLEGANEYKHLWLGANDGFNNHTFNGPFFWSATGKQFSYTNWELFYPLRSVLNLKCVLIVTPKNEWLNYNCDDKWGFICEQKQRL
ncbi:C-type lectin domain-containing protein, partial [Klebsiella pneumoniae]|uniref:C-type lectin domain-containing protein n=1 Tax=Klebsiella pneumoniae TaxID=573 RepID=UPI003B592C08